MAMTQGLLSKLVADTSPGELVGSAFGFLNLALGMAMLIGNIFAGALWETIGSQATFVAGSVFALIAIGIAQVLLPPKPGPA